MTVFFMLLKCIHFNYYSYHHYQSTDLRHSASPRKMHPINSTYNKRSTLPLLYLENKESNAYLSSTIERHLFIINRRHPLLSWNNLSLLLFCFNSSFILANSITIVIMGIKFHYDSTFHILHTIHLKKFKSPVWQKKRVEISVRLLLEIYLVRNHL